MAGGGKGGKTTSEVKIPAWLEQAAQRNIGRAEEIARIGPVVERGPTVAAFTDPQQQAFYNTGAAASAFGMAPAGTDMRYQPAATDYGSVQGYSMAPIYDQMLDAHRAAAPAQYDFMTGMFINPLTGAMPTGAFGMPAPAPAPVAPSYTSTGPDRTQEERDARFGGGSTGTGNFGEDLRGFRDSVFRR